MGKHIPNSKFRQKKKVRAIGLRKKISFEEKSIVDQSVQVKDCFVKRGGKREVTIKSCFLWL